MSATACATKSGLEPGPGAMSIGHGKNQIVDNLEGVELVANANAWKGTPEIVEQVIPIKVVVRNKHGRAVRVQDRHFSLVTDTGQTYAAQSPDQIKGEIRVASPGYYAGPSFYYHSFAAPPVFGYYPGVPGVVEPFYYDPFFYSRYYNYYQEMALPTKDMVSDALPPMDLPDGGEVSGFLYFNKIEDASQANLKMEIVETDGTRVGTISMPFLVEKKALKSNK